jgi:hypothetical protein
MGRSEFDDMGRHYAIHGIAVCLVNAINWLDEDVRLLLLDNFAAMFPR